MTEQITPEYLSFATEHHASDIFIIAGRPLSFKINGKLSIYGERLMPADKEILLRQIYQMSNNRNFDRFLKIGDDDFSFSIPGLSRFRVNTYRQRGSLAKDKYSGVICSVILNLLCKQVVLCLDSRQRC